MNSSDSDSINFSNSPSFSSLPVEDDAGSQMGIFDASTRTLRLAKTWPVAQRYHEYLTYMSNFPKLVASDRSKLKVCAEVLYYSSI